MASIEGFSQPKKTNGNEQPTKGGGATAGGNGLGIHMPELEKSKKPEKVAKVKKIEQSDDIDTQIKNLQKTLNRTQNTETMTRLDTGKRVAGEAKDKYWGELDQKLKELQRERGGIEKDKNDETSITDVELSAEDLESAKADNDGTQIGTEIIDEDILAQHRSELEPQTQMAAAAEAIDAKAPIQEKNYFEDKPESKESLMLAWKGDWKAGDRPPGYERTSKRQRALEQEIDFSVEEALGADVKDEMFGIIRKARKQGGLEQEDMDRLLEINRTFLTALDEAEKKALVTGNNDETRESPAMQEVSEVEQTKQQEKAKRRRFRDIAGHWWPRHARTQSKASEPTTADYDPAAETQDGTPAIQEEQKPAFDFHEKLQDDAFNEFASKHPEQDKLLDSPELQEAVAKAYDVKEQVKASISEILNEEVGKKMGIDLKDAILSGQIEQQIGNIENEARVNPERVIGLQNKFENFKNKEAIIVGLETKLQTLTAGVDVEKRIKELQEEEKQLKIRANMHKFIVFEKGDTKFRTVTKFFKNNLTNSAILRDIFTSNRGNTLNLYKERWGALKESPFHSVTERWKIFKEHPLKVWRLIDIPTKIDDALGNIREQIKTYSSLDEIKASSEAARGAHDKLRMDILEAVGVASAIRDVMKGRLKAEFEKFITSGKPKKGEEPGKNLDEAEKFITDLENMPDGFADPETLEHMKQALDGAFEKYVKTSLGKALRNIGEGTGKSRTRELQTVVNGIIAKESMGSKDNEEIRALVLEKLKVHQQEIEKDLAETPDDDGAKQQQFFVKSLIRTLERGKRLTS